MSTATATLTQSLDSLFDTIVADAGLTDDEILSILADVQAKADATVRSLTAPITHSQRGAMFGAFTQVFGDAPKAQRRVFTRLVLGKSADTPVSWADHGNGTLTQREASKVLDALVALEATI